MNEKKHITEISNFTPKANGYFGLSGLDVLRYLLLVVCLNVSSGICVVWWWVRIEISLSLSLPELERITQRTHTHTHTYRHSTTAEWRKIDPWVMPR